jgi:hypothetical protein
LLLFPPAWFCALPVRAMSLTSVFKDGSAILKYGSAILKYGSAILKYGSAILKYGSAILKDGYAFYEQLFVKKRPSCRTG